MKLLFLCLLFLITGCEEKLDAPITKITKCESSYMEGDSSVKLLAIITTTDDLVDSIINTNTVEFKTEKEAKKAYNNVSMESGYKVTIEGKSVSMVYEYTKEYYLKNKTTLKEAIEITEKKGFNCQLENK